MKLVSAEFKSGGLHEKYVVATWNLGNHLQDLFTWKESSRRDLHSLTSEFVCCTCLYLATLRKGKNERTGLKLNVNGI